MKRASLVTSRFETILSSVPDIVLIVDARGRCTWANGAGKDFFGEGVIGSDEVVGFRRAGGAAVSLRQLLDDRRETLSFETWHRRADGQERLLAWRCRILGDGEQTVETVCAARDITAQAETQKKILQSQRLEAVGRLAGGVAHDFNNVLTTISCYCVLMRERAAEDEATLEDLREIQKAADRAGYLTKQLLAFSRRQVLEPRTLNLNEVVGNLAKLLRRSLGEDIELVTHVEPALAPIEADPAQINEALLNLATNARDAMPSGGKLVIETANVRLEERDTAGRAPMPPGRYVKLLISDTGVGMDATTRARIFEPFFTTKHSGRGTGLGLASVYGIVKQNKGFIWVSSIRGEGTTFTIYFPPTVEAREPARPPSRKAAPGHPFTILLVEDDELVRRVTVDILSTRGYTVLVTDSAEGAFALSQDHEGPIHLLLTDVVLPKIDGRELAQSLSRARGEMRYLFMTGYADEALSGRGILQGLSPLLKKPFTPESLLAKIEEVLGR